MKGKEGHFLMTTVPVQEESTIINIWAPGNRKPIQLKLKEVGTPQQQETSITHFNNKQNIQTDFSQEAEEVGNIFAQKVEHHSEHCAQKQWVKHSSQKKHRSSSGDLTS